MIEGIRKLLEYSSFEYSDRWLPNDPRMKRLGKELLGIDVNTPSDAARVAEAFMDMNNELNQYCTSIREYEATLFRSFETGQTSVTTRLGYYPLAYAGPKPSAPPPGTEQSYNAKVELMHCDVPDVGRFYLIRRQSVASDGATTIMLRVTAGRAAAEKAFSNAVADVRRGIKAARRGVRLVSKFISKEGEEGSE